MNPQPPSTKKALFLTPPEGVEALAPDQVDPETGRPLWIPDRPGARWLTVRPFVQLPRRGRVPERLIVQDRAYTEDPQDSPTRDSFADGPVNLNPPPIAPWSFPRARFHSRPKLDPRSKRGRPSWADRNPQFPVYVAWARDVAGVTLDDLAAILGQGQGAVPPLADQGRGLLALWGVLPWGAYRDGRPPRDWPHDERFLNALGPWATEAEHVSKGGTFEPVRPAA